MLSWSRFRILFACSAVALPTSPLAAQDAALVDVLAGVLQSEDMRQYNGPLLEAASRHPDPVVRRTAAMAIGRIGDFAATPLLIEQLTDRDTSVQRYAAFALGLLRDSTAFSRLREIALNTPQDEQYGLHEEAVTAIAKLGGGQAALFFRELLGPWASRGGSAAPPRTVAVALEQSWRLGRLAPVDLLIEFTVSPLRRAKIGAVYSLARLRSPAAADVLLAATGSGEEEIRAHAVRALTAAYADTAGLDRTALANRVRRLASDEDPHVRINALRSLATYRDSVLVPTVIDRLSDQDANVRVRAVTTLAELGGRAAVERLEQETRRRPWAVQRAAMIALARLAGLDALASIGGWLTDGDWRSRAAGAEALGYIAQDTVVPWLVHMTRDQDPRVATVALQSLIALAPDAATQRARRLVEHPDAVVRTVAADRLAGLRDTADIDRLVRAWDLAARDSIPDARLAVLTALGQIADRGVSERLAVDDRFLSRNRSNDDYLLRRAARDRYPEAARRWGPVTPIATGLSIEDYRDIARRFVAPGGDGERHIVIETDRGRVGIELFTEDAPLTVAALLRLIDQRYFDASAWHRVVPDFIIQAGDPRGDGWGGPGFALRDEINVHRYRRGTVGMALSGPDTGGSQFFITHSPQPHLDGTYTVIGRVEFGMDVVDLITQGDRIRRVRRP